MDTILVQRMRVRKEIVRFFASGTIVTLTDFGTYYALLHLLPLSAAKGLSFACAGIIGYVLNKYWTFKQNEQSFVEVRRYVLINFLALGINVLTNQSVLNVWAGAVWHWRSNKNTITFSQPLFYFVL